MKGYYFDYASTTPLDPRVFKAMKPYFFNNFGNPANLYGPGREAKLAIQKSLEKISSVLNCSPEEFIFTASATESNNLAITQHATYNTQHFITTEIEHKSILEPLKELEKNGHEVTYLTVDKNGIIKVSDLKKAIKNNTVLVSIAYANSEIGAIQPIKEIGRLLKKINPKIYFHTDASQAASYLDLNIQNLGVDLMTLSSHKIYGPKGVACLFIKGGKRGLRVGTENVPGIVGFSEALFLNQKDRIKEGARLEKLRDKLQSGIMKSIPKVVLNGHLKKRLPNFLNVSILDVEGEAMLLHLDKLGIYAATGSACNSESLEPSRVITALGRPYVYSHGSLRFSLGKYTTEASINYVLKHLPAVVANLRRISPLNIKIDK